MGRGRTKVAHRVERGKVIKAPRGLERGSCGRARMVGNEDRSRKPRVDTRKKDNLERNSRGDGGFTVSKAARRGDTRSGRTPRGLTATRYRRFMKIAVSLWAWFKCDYANHRLNVNSEERCRRAQVGPVEPLTQGGVTLGPEPGANFCYLGGEGEFCP